DHAALSTGGPDEEKTGRVQLMTLHKAKGLEFLHVFLPTWEAGVFQLLDRRDRLRRGLKALAASRQLGYAIPEKSLAEGLERAPDYIGADMGTIARICAADFRGELPLLNR